MKLAEQEAEIGKRMEKKQKKARKNALKDRQMEIQNDTLDQEGYPQATMLKAAYVSRSRTAAGKYAYKYAQHRGFAMERHPAGHWITSKNQNVDVSNLPEKPRGDDYEDEKGYMHRILKKSSLPLIILTKAKYLSRKKVNGKWVYRYSTPQKGKKPEVWNLDAPKYKAAIEKTAKELLRRYPKGLRWALNGDFMPPKGIENPFGRALTHNRRGEWMDAVSDKYYELKKEAK